MGDVEVFDLDSCLKTDLIYSDAENRPCQSVSCSEKLYVQIRNFGILIFMKKTEKWENAEFLESNHVGFCNSLVLDSRIFYISQKSGGKSIICWEGGGVLEIDETTPMHMSSHSDRLVLGSEDGKIRILQNYKFTTEVRPIAETIFATAISDDQIACGYSKSPILIFSNDSELSPREIHYPQTSSGCSALQFSPNSKQLLAGFWDGSVRVFSAKKLAVLLVLSNAHGSTVTGLVWKTTRECVTCSNDGTVAVWNFEK